MIAVEEEIEVDVAGAFCELAGGAIAAEGAFDGEQGVHEFGGGRPGFEGGGGVDETPENRGRIDGIGFVEGGNGEDVGVGRAAICARAAPQGGFAVSEV